MTWLVTGGAGYIGAHVVRAFQAQGLDAVVLDDLSSGHREFVPADVPFVDGTILDTDLLVRTLREHDVTGVVHVAGFKYAGVSVQRPLHTYEQNVTGTVSVLKAMAEAEVDKVVFSSSAATFGTPDVDTVTEETPTRPESPYGESKLIGEWLLRDQETATGLAHTSLRYFNVVGSGSDEVYDTSPHNLFPLVIEALIEGRTPRINGDDYPTPDGTCVRDYIHVADLADAHLLALEATAPGDRRTDTALVCNLGNAGGFSIREVLDATARLVGHEVPHAVGPRRAGDPPILVASAGRARDILRWRPRRPSLDEIIGSALDWRRTHPRGYRA